MKITTTHGEMDESALVKKTGELDNENEFTTWVEYYLGDELVHRSASVRLKKNVFCDGVAAMLGS
jgi:hypothetical protein